MPRRVNVFGHVDLPRLREGGVAGQFFSFWTTPYPERGCARAVDDASSTRSTRDRRSSPSELAWTRTGADVRAAKAAGKIAALGGIEGGQALEGDARDDRGVLAPRRALPRPAPLLGQRDRPARQGQAAPMPSAGLTAFGRDVVRECERCGVIVDLAHINRRGFFDALELATQPPMVSHTGVLGVHEHWRNIDDEQIRAVADKRRLRRHHLRAQVPRLGVDRCGRRSPAPRDRRRRRGRARARLATSTASSCRPRASRTSRRCRT